MNPASENHKFKNHQSDMISSAYLQRLTLLTAVEGLVVLMITFMKPSEPDAAKLLGFSYERLILGAITLVVVLLFLSAHQSLRKKPDTDPFIKGYQRFLHTGDHVFFVLIACIAGVLLSIWSFVFSWLFIPANLRPQILWLGIFFLQATVLLLRYESQSIRGGEFLKKYRLLPRFADLSKNQKTVLFVLVAFSILYILILIPSNINGTQSPEAFQHYGGDEVVIYPILMDVMKEGETFSATLYHLFIYEDYHYGYPFYAWSALVLLPVKLLNRANFPDMISINLPLLRIFVSVIPVILACMIITWLFTRFNHILLSLAVFVFLLLTPGTLQNNQGFWHPDGLNLLFVCLVLYFLQRDRLRFGRNFYLAAVCTGLSIGTRLYGFFFVTAVAVYLIMGLSKKNLRFRTAIFRGFIFFVLMCATVLFVDPFLFRADARDRMVEIMQEKSGEMAEGYAGDYDPRNDYRPGWDAWYPAFEDHYTEMFCFFFLIASLLFGCFYGKFQLAHRMEFFWFLMIGGYLIFFVAVKSTQYVLPVLLPLMGTIFSIPLAIQSGKTHAFFQKKWIQISAWLLASSIYLAQLTINFFKILPRFR
jgi:hypothetical protein